MDRIAARVAARFKKATEGRVMESAAFTNGNGAMTLSLLVDASKPDWPSWTLRSEVAHFGVRMSSDIHISSQKMANWLITALQRSMSGMRFEGFEDDPEVKIIAGQEAPDTKVYRQQDSEP